MVAAWLLIYSWGSVDVVLMYCCTQDCSGPMRYMQHALRSDLLQALLSDIAASKAAGMLEQLKSQHASIKKKLGGSSRAVCTAASHCTARLLGGLALFQCKGLLLSRDMAFMLFVLCHTEACKKSLDDLMAQAQMTLEEAQEAAKTYVEAKVPQAATAGQQAPPAADEDAFKVGDAFTGFICAAHQCWCSCSVAYRWQIKLYMPLLGDVQADYVELKLQEAALLNLSSGQHQGELMALDPGLVRAWGDGLCFSIDCWRSPPAHVSVDVYMCHCCKGQ
jgi:hypothetical protein